MLNDVNLPHDLRNSNSSNDFTLNEDRWKLFPIYCLDRGRSHSFCGARGLTCRSARV